MLYLDLLLSGSSNSAPLSSDRGAFFFLFCQTIVKKLCAPLGRGIPEMIKRTYRCARGASIRIMYAVTSGNADSVVPAVAAMRLSTKGVLSGPQILLPWEPRLASAQIPAGFDIMISPQLSQSMKVGDYELNALLQISGTIEETQPCLIVIHQSAASPA